MEDTKRRFIQAYLDQRFRFLTQHLDAILFHFKKILELLEELRRGAECKYFKQKMAEYKKTITHLRTEILEEIRNYYDALHKIAEEHISKSS